MILRAFLQGVAVVVLVVLTCGAPAAVHAQGDSGALRGSVQDADFYVPLSGISIQLEGTGFSASSDADGNFFINGVPPGQYALLATGSGFVRERKTGIVITPGGVREVSVSMTAEVVELDEFVVSAEELVDTDTGVAALTLRTELKSFTDVMGAKFIAQTGATDAAKLLAKQTGVNVADGKFVVVRGLNDRYNVVSLNSLRVPSSDPDRRAVALDLFPSSVIEDIRTSKTFVPDLNGESTGGTINIITKAVPDRDFAKFKVGTGYNTQSTGNDKFLSYRGGGTGTFGTADSRKLPDFIKNDPLPNLTNFAASGVGNGLTPVDHPTRVARQRVTDALSPVMGTQEVSAPVDFTLEGSLGHRTEFMGAPAGITVAGDYSKKYIYNDDDLVGRYSFTGAGDPNAGEVLEVRRLSTVRSGQETMRAGLLVAAGFEPDEGSEIIFTYFFNRIAEDRATLQDGKLDSSYLPTQRDYRESLAYTERQLKVMQLTGKHQETVNGKDLNISWGLAYNQSSQLEPDHRFVRGIFNQDTGSYIPVPGNPVVPEFQRLWRELYDQNYSARIDVETDLFEGADGEKMRLKFGAFMDSSSRDYRADSFTYNRGLENQSYPNGLKPLIPNNTWGDEFLSNNPPVGSDPDGIPNNGPLSSVGSFTYLYRANEKETYEASQLMAAGYAALEFDLGPSLNITLGGRVESTDININSTPIWLYADPQVRYALLSERDRLGPDDTVRQLVDAAFQGNAAARNDPRLLARSRASIQEQHFLPALSLNWDMTDTMRVRSSVARTVARPSFKELAPVVFLNVESGDMFVGNVDLEMSTIMNYDMRWEWFPSAGSLIGVSFFAKKINKPIELSQESGNVDIIRYVNSKEGSVYGLELEFQRDLGFIADPLRHFSIGANYSYIKSQATRPDFIGNTVDQNGDPETVPSLFGSSRRLQGQPDYIVNFNLTYDNPEFPLSYGAFLNVTGPQLFAVGGRPEDPDVFQEPYSTLDLGVTYRMTKSSRVSLRAQNVLNAQLKRYYNNKGKPVHSTRQTGVGFSLSMTVDW